MKSPKVEDKKPPSRKPTLILLAVAVIIVSFLIIPPVIVSSGKYKIYTTVNSVPAQDVAIVFGAGVYSSGRPTSMLQDRLDIAIKLHAEGKIKHIIVSGDNRTHDYNEPQAMYNYLVNKGVSEDAVVRDYAGRRTYDTCYRARHIFGVDKAILITQGYHLPRAIFTCNSLGVSSSGFSATIRDYPGDYGYKAREIAAIYASVLDVYILKPTPVLGERIEL